MITLEVDKQIPLKNILFATDFSSGSEAALPYAVSLARQHGAMLHVAHVMATDPHLFVTPASWPALVQAEEDWAREEVVRLAQKLQGVPHTLLVRSGDVFKVLTRFIEERDIDLLVLGTHGWSDLQEMSMGSTAKKLVQAAPCPILTVGRKTRCRPEAPLAVYRIPLPTIFNRASLSSLPYAVSALP